MNPDPLAPLRPLHLPDQIGWWPPAPGWWLLAGVAAVVLGGEATATAAQRSAN